MSNYFIFKNNGVYIFYKFLFILIFASYCKYNYLKKNKTRFTSIIKFVFKFKFLTQQ